MSDVYHQLVGLSTVWAGRRRCHVSGASPLGGNLRERPPRLRPAVVDRLGLVALGELLAFERMAADARLARIWRRRAALGEMAAAEIANYRRLVGEAIVQAGRVAAADRGALTTLMSLRTSRWTWPA